MIISNFATNKGMTLSYELDGNIYCFQVVNKGEFSHFCIQKQPGNAVFIGKEKVKLKRFMPRFRYKQSEPRK